MHDDRDLDTLLDEALASYVDAEPDSSLRARITARTTKAAHRPWHIWTLAPLAACAAALALAIFLLHPEPQMPAPQAAAARIISPAAPAPPGAVKEQVPRPAVERARAFKTTRRHASTTLQRSRLAASDDALTEEDRILLKFVAEHPKEAQQLLTPPPQPVEIKPLAIPPIEIADLSVSSHSEGFEPDHFEK